MIVKYSLGLDVSSKDIKACLATIDNEQHVKVKSSKTIANTKKGMNELLAWIKKWYSDLGIPLSVCMEATGVYHENCAYFLYDNGFNVSIVLPNKAKKYLQAIGIKSKNDTIDAKGLAQMGAEQKLEVWEPMGTFYYELRVLTRQHQSLKESLTAEQSRLHAANAASRQISFEIKQIKNHINFLEKQVEKLEQEIKRLIHSDETLKKKFERVMKLYGISYLSSATIIAETGGFLLFKNYKQLVSYAGYDVIENQSGNHVGKTKISKKGNSRIRRILHMPSLTAIGKEDTIFNQLYRRVVERSGVKMKGIVAVQKKLLLMIYYIWTKDIDYNPNFRNIQEEDQAPSSPLSITMIKKATQSAASQGRHPVSNHSMPPLRLVKV
jgi:transposase